MWRWWVLLCTPKKIQMPICHDNHVQTIWQYGHFSLQYLSIYFVALRKKEEDCILKAMQPPFITIKVKFITGFYYWTKSLHTYVALKNCVIHFAFFCTRLLWKRSRWKMSIFLYHFFGIVDGLCVLFKKIGKERHGVCVYLSYNLYFVSRLIHNVYFLISSSFQKDFFWKRWTFDGFSFSWKEYDK